jgi:uncharacterized membrane protein
MARAPGLPAVFTSVTFNYSNPPARTLPMPRLVPIGRWFFALALLGLGAEHFLFGTFVTGRPPEWPESVPGERLGAYLSGAVIMLAGIAMLAGRRARSAAMLAAALIFLWAVVRHIPVVATDSLLSPAWTKAGKALMLFGGTLAMAGTFPPEAGSRATASGRFLNLSGEFIVLGRVCLGSFLLITGIQHFMYTEFVASLIPAWFPGDAVFWTRFAGVALIAGGAGHFHPRTAPLAALLSGAMVFSWVWIVHLPRTFASVSDGIAIFEALAVCGLAFVLAGYRNAPRSRA